MLGPWKKGVEVRTDAFGNYIGGLNPDSIQPWMQEKSFVLVDSLTLLHELVTEAIKAGHCVIDLETQGLDNRVYNGEIRHKIVGFALCYDGETGFYVPVRHDPDIEPKGNLPWEQVKAEIQRLLYECVILYHNSNFDQETLWAEGFDVPEDPNTFEDTQLMLFCVDSNRKRLGLKSCAEDLLGRKMIEFKDLFPKGTKVPKFDTLHPEEAYIYASSDTLNTYELWRMYKDNPVLKDQAFIYKIEKWLVFTLRRMVRHQVLIDIAYLQELDKQVEQECQGLVNEIRRLCGEPDLNIDSAKQLGDILFDKLKIPNAGRTGEDGKGKQYKTDRQTLEDLDKKYEGQYPALTKVVKYRQLEKLRGTYIANLINNVDHNQEARFGIMACGAPTGRFAAPGGDPDQGFSGVNVQSIPKVKKGKANIRKAFKARPGFKIAAIDFSGVELRIAGNLSLEPKWVSEFNHTECQQKYGEHYEVIGRSLLDQKCAFCGQKMGDVHSQTSQAVFGTAEEPYRSKSKGVNFGILYGAGGKTIAENIGVSSDEGFRVVKTFLDSLPSIKGWIKRQHEAAHKKGFVKTAFGRYRFIPEVKAEEKGMVAFGERTAVNSPVQGTSADITKIAMVGCDKLIRERGWKDDCRILLTVHDEIVFEVRESMKDIIMPALAESMCKCHPKGWPIPLAVDIEYGDNWGEVDNAWKPAAPILRPRHSNPPALPYEARIWDGEGEPPVVVPAKPPKQEVPKVEAKQVEVVERTAPSVVPTATPEPLQVEEQSAVEVEPATPGAETIFTYKVSRPYTDHKLRKLEALFILAGEGNVRLRLVSETGQDMLGTRKVLINPVAFEFAARLFGV